MLYIVPTPIGNLRDITLRAIDTLKEVDLILAEDTRTSSKLLSHYDIKTPCTAYHMHNEHNSTAKFIAQLQEGKKIALITDAGTPGISDPAFFIVRECRRNNIAVTCLPGATAFVPAIVMSGMPSDSFIFLGFLPIKKGRKTTLTKLKQDNRTFILYESPYRIQKTLDDLIETFGHETEIFIARELSKIHEESLYFTLGEAKSLFECKTPRGEFVLVVKRSE